MNRKEFFRTAGRIECSVGCVKEMFGLRFGRDVDVDLLDSVLKGGKRCRFKIAVI